MRSAREFVPLSSESDVVETFYRKPTTQEAGMAAYIRTSPDERFTAEFKKSVLSPENGVTESFLKSLAGSSRTVTDQQ